MSASLQHPLRRPYDVATAFLRMDFIEDMSYPLWLILHHFALMVPVFIYYFIGELVGDAPTVGGDYFTFATIGLCVATLLQTTLAGFGWTLTRAQDRGTFESLLVEPVPWPMIPLAMSLWRALLGLVGATLVFVLGLALGADYRLSGMPAFIVIIVLAVVAAVAVGMLAAPLIVLSKRAQPLLNLYGTAATVLAGALFSVDQLPRALQFVSWAIPHTYAINASRGVLMEDPGTFTIPLGTALWALTIFNAIALSAGLWLLSRALQYGRKMGLVSGY